MVSLPLPASYPPSVHERSVGALLGCFAGDALGMPWEGAPLSAIPVVVEMVEARLGRGTYSDDTEMAIAVAESLLRCDVVDEDDLARTLVARHDPRRGYDATTTRVLALLRVGTPVTLAARQELDSRASLGAGAAARVAPVAVRFFEDSVLLDTQSRLSARVTHPHPVSVDAAAVQAAAVAAAIDGEDPLRAAAAAARTDAVRTALEAVVQRCAGGVDPLALAGPAPGVPARADAAVAAAVAAGALARRFEDAVVSAVQAGGATDSVAAMAGAIAGARFGAGAIPRRWIDHLEDGDRGRSHVASQATALADRAIGAVAGGPPQGGQVR